MSFCCRPIRACPVAALTHCTAVRPAQPLPDTREPVCTVIGVADRSGGIINENGLDVPALRHHVNAKPPFGGSLRTFPGGVLTTRL